MSNYTKSTIYKIYSRDPEITDFILDLHVMSFQKDMLINLDVIIQMIMHTITTYIDLSGIMVVGIIFN